MLAYSSIAHGGYLLARADRRPMTSARARCCSTCSTYAVTNLGAFGVIALLESADGANDQVRDYAGSVERRIRRSPRS